MRTLKRPSVLVALGICLGLTGLLFWGLAVRSSQNGAAQRAPDFTLNLYNGEQVELSDLKGAPVVVNFWASWCPPCRQEAPALQKAWEAYAGKGVIFVGVDVQDTRDAAQAFIDTYGVTFPNGPDTGGNIARLYGITGVPETFFISRDGRVLRHWQGPLDEATMAGFLGELLA